MGGTMKNIEKVRKVMDNLQLECEVRKNNSMHSIIICFERPIRRKVRCEMEKVLKKEGFNTLCGIKSFNLFRKKNEKCKDN